MPSFCGIAMALPHARGGVSDGHISAHASDASSPRAWGCFQARVLTCSFPARTPKAPSRPALYFQARHHPLPGAARQDRNHPLCGILPRPRTPQPAEPCEVLSDETHLPTCLPLCSALRCPSAVCPALLLQLRVRLPPRQGARRSMRDSRPSPKTSSCASSRICPRSVPGCAQAARRRTLS